MNKLNLILALLLIQTAFASSIQSSHPIYFNGGDVKPHKSVSFDLPYQQMSPNVLYDVSCSITGIDIASHQPILNIKIIVDKVSQNYYPTPISSINDFVFTYPFQDKLIEQNNKLIIQNFSCNAGDNTSSIQLSVYNFDDNESVTFSNCYIIVSKQNA